MQRMISSCKLLHPLPILLPRLVCGKNRPRGDYPSKIEAIDSSFFCFLSIEETTPLPSNKWFAVAHHLIKTFSHYIASTYSAKKTRDDYPSKTKQQICAVSAFHPLKKQHNCYTINDRKLQITTSRPFPIVLPGPICRENWPLRDYPSKIDAIHLSCICISSIEKTTQLPSSKLRSCRLLDPFLILSPRPIGWKNGPRGDYSSKIEEMVETCPKWWTLVCLTPLNPNWKCLH